MTQIDDQHRAMAAMALLDDERAFEIRQYRPDLADDEPFLQWANQPELEGFRIEADANEVVSIMSPTGWISGPMDAYVLGRLQGWAERDGSGYVSDAQATYHLPHMGRRVPDAAWISRQRLQSVPPELRRGILTVAPEFVVEIRSPLDQLARLQDNMQLWISDGVMLGLLLDPANKRADVYSANRPVFYARDMFQGDLVLIGFELDLVALWKLYDEIINP
jgi:Uma2 family endonuclease